MTSFEHMRRLSPKKGKLENRSVSISAVELQSKAFQSLHKVFGHPMSFSFGTVRSYFSLLL